MLSLGSIGFAAPWILLALVALPVLWFILRAIPPAPIRRLFPGVTLLLGLQDEDHVSDRTPWWLLLLRCLAIGALIIGLARPILNPDTERSAGTGPVLVAMDAGWASGHQWEAQMAAIDAVLIEAARDGRPAAVLKLTDPQPVTFQSADVWRQQLSGIAPEPWAPPDALDLETVLPDGQFDTVWLSDGVERPSRGEALRAFEARGDVRVIESAAQILVLEPASFADGLIQLNAIRSTAEGARSITLAARGTDPGGAPQILASLPLDFDEGALRAEGELALPAELRARLTQFSIVGNTSTAAVTLPDDRLRRREIALFAGRSDREGLELLSPLHYLSKALAPSSDLLDAPFAEVFPANPDVIILADVASLTQPEVEDLTAWAEDGGLLLRFAGPKLAASNVGRDADDPLMPVRLRAGGRTVGGAMSWGEPKALAPFDEDSPFYGLPLSKDVRVVSQVVAQPDPTLANRTIASLSDGTPLVTRKALGAGQVVLIHVSANAEWSGLPLSGLFVQMLERLSVSGGGARPDAEELDGTIWQPVQVLDGFGILRPADTLPGVDGPALVSDPLGPEMRPGLYQTEGRALARNVAEDDMALSPAVWPARIPVTGLTLPQEEPLAGLMLSAAMLLLLADVLASLWVSGRLFGTRGFRAASVVLALGMALPLADPALAQSGAQTSDTAAVDATREFRLAYVETGRQIDETSRAGMAGLTRVLVTRTSVEPAAPVGVDLEQHELAFFPLLYWPVLPDAPLPSAEAYAKLNTYLRTGGLILFDTLDGDIAGAGGASPNGRRLQQIARGLDIPPLEPVPQDHVLTRTFYLLQDFPGRYVGQDVWVEAAPPDAQQVEGMPFRNLNDGVTPIIIGGNHWAAAWAIDDQGRFRFPVERGYGGERQRELSYRFGVNLVMHVLSGNYKSDQVHVPALLERLGQ